MKRLVLWIMTLSLLMAACTAPHEGQQYLPELVAEGDFSEALYQALSDDWAAYDAMSEEEKMCSSHLPGWCSREFDEWEAVEQFVGLTIPNPLEELELLEKGTYVGMPLGFAGASRFSISFYGTNEGKVQWIFADSGYRDGDIRIMVNMQIFPDTMQENAKETEDARITEDSGERYVASEAALARGPVTYNIRVIGEPGTQTQVKETLEKVLPYFYDTMEKETVDK